jgi:hypothetical protein
VDIISNILCDLPVGPTSYWNWLMTSILEFLKIKLENLKISQIKIKKKKQEG